MNRLRHSLFFFNDTATTEIYTLSLHDALPIYRLPRARSDLSDRRQLDVVASGRRAERRAERRVGQHEDGAAGHARSEEHTSELQSRQYLVCRLLLEKKITEAARVVSMRPTVIY